MPSTPSHQAPQGAVRGLSLAVLLALLLVLVAGCARIRDPMPPPESIAEGRLPRLAEVFYQRIANRRFNSIATFHDPALREFFATPEAFADYYADLAQALDAARFEANRPLRIELLEYELTEPNRVLIHIHFSGGNARPLRFWSSHLMRADQWKVENERWLIIPGKL